MDEDQTALTTATGVPLLITSAVRAHLVAHPTVWPVLAEAVARLTLPETENLCAVEIDLGRPLQRASLLPAPSLGLDTLASFALRHNRAHPSRVTEEAPTSWDSTVVIWVKRAAASAPFELATAFIGKLGPLEPWDPHLASRADFQIALDFWSRNALVHDAQIMQSIFISSWGEILRKAQSPFL
jgi:hypothetical protein